MKRFHQFNKLVLRLGLLATFVIACKLASVNVPAVQSVRNSVRSIQNFASRAETPSFQDKPAIAPIDVVWEMLRQVSKDLALVDLRKLTGEEEICIDTGCHTITNRLTGSEGLQWAKDYIYKELVRLGYSVEIRDWSLEGLADENIIARKAGIISPAEEIYFVAHIDGVGTGIKQFPAADDDGSGVVDMLEMARILSNYSFNRTVVLFFSTGEEQGRLGSRFYLNELSPEEISSIKYAVDLDMVGYDANEDGVMELWDGGDSSSLPLAHMMSQIIETYQIGLSPVFVTGCG